MLNRLHEICISFHIQTSAIHSGTIPDISVQEDALQSRLQTQHPEGVAFGDHRILFPSLSLHCMNSPHEHRARHNCSLDLQLSSATLQALQIRADDKYLETAQKQINHRHLSCSLSALKSEGNRD